MINRLAHRGRPSSHPWREGPTGISRWTPAILLALMLPVGGCTRSEPLAEVDAEVITAKEVETALGASLARLREQIYSIKRQKVEALIAARLLANEAAKRSITVQALLDAEVTRKVGPVTEQEIESFYQANRARLQGDETTIRKQIMAHLQNQKLAAQRESLIQSLRSQAKVVVHLKAPPVLRTQLSQDGAPFKGPATAPTTIVKFEDFHCSFCKGAQATLEQVLSRYGEKVKLVHRDFPIDSLHPHAAKAHEAARCANEQGKFWAYHDLLYTKTPAEPQQLQAYARAVELDVPAFEQCLSSRKYGAAVQKDVEEGTRSGVTGTPTFFVNGRMLTGAQPLESFLRVIEEELAR
jgi:protein-disulfide isomerase